MLFDTHAHYDDGQFDADRFELLEQMPKNNVGLIVNVGTDVETSKKSIEFAEKYSFVYAACGFHPEFANLVNDESLKEIEKMAKHEKVVAIGESGLDYYWEDNPSKEVQIEAFKKQIALANKLNLPLIIHNREATGDLIKVLKENPLNNGIIHCVSVSKESAEIFLKMGLYVSFAGTLTFKNAPKLSEVAKIVPLDKMLVETDCPYLSPEPNRGTRNSSLNVKYTLAKLAEIKGISVEEAEKLTFENGKRVYNLR